MIINTLFQLAVVRLVVTHDWILGDIQYGMRDSESFFVAYDSSSHEEIEEVKYAV